MTVDRPQIAGARRVVVKVGSSSLTTLPGGLDAERLSALVDVLGGVRSAGREVVLVSSGAIAAGLGPPPRAPPRPPAPPRGGPARGGWGAAPRGAPPPPPLPPPRHHRRPGAA